LRTKSLPITVLNKVDLKPDLPLANWPADALPISAKTGEGLDSLVERLATEAEAIAGGGGDTAVVTRARHRVELEAAKAALERFRTPGLSPELRAEELRIAAHHLGRLTGRIGVEEVLGAIFAEFCIGK
jgi:tRNA modification GTPase